MDLLDVAAFLIYSVGSVGMFYLVWFQPEFIKKYAIRKRRFLIGTPISSLEQGCSTWSWRIISTTAVVAVMLTILGVLKFP